jgi:hypothetical protein
MSTDTPRRPTGVNVGSDAATALNREWARSAAAPDVYLFETSEIAYGRGSNQEVVHMPNETDKSAPFSKPEPAAAKSVEHEDEQNSPFTLIGYGAMFALFAVGVNLFWNSIALPTDSFAGGRNALLRRLIGRIGQTPLTAIFAAVALVFFSSAVIGYRNKQTNQK